MNNPNSISNNNTTATHSSNLATPLSASSQEWKTNLKSTLNRLTTQYLNVLRAASSEVALIHESEEGYGVSGGSSGVVPGTKGIVTDPRAGGGHMTSINEPTPPLSASATISTFQTKLATQNIITTSNQLLDLIRILRLSALLLDETCSKKEADVECWENDIVIDLVSEECGLKEKLLMELRQNDNDTGTM
mmetsp:Transcript_12075/g.14974  ORF Transcript_12075/g.14974 Transcript_12075/m.14974 type:complete len:191 (+) Transcript_12075:94-666(+)